MKDNKSKVIYERPFRKVGMLYKHKIALFKSNEFRTIPMLKLKQCTIFFSWFGFRGYIY